MMKSVLLKINAKLAGIIRKILLVEKRYVKNILNSTNKKIKRV